MLELKFIRENPEFVIAEIKKLNTEAPILEILDLDKRWREKLKEVDSLKNLRNARSKEIGQEKDQNKRQLLISQMQEVNQKIKDLDKALKEIEEKLNYLLLLVPNLPHPSTPIGKDETENVIVKEWGEKKKFDFTPLSHWELGENLRIIDFEKGVKISGTRFYVLKGMGAALQRALISWMLDLHIKEHNYLEIYPPAMVKKECLFGTGQLPKFEENLYFDGESDLWFIPTAEVPLTNLHREEVLPPGSLPIYYAAYTPCFRKEKMSAGKDTRGIKRGHQFDKVELVKIVKPEESQVELENLIKNAEEIPKRLNIPYRVAQMCSGDLSFSACAKYDLEMWAPGCGEWLEVSSCSNFGDFQARRANIKFKRAINSKPEFAHTLNGSGLALPRTLIALLENYQQKDGSILVPEVLRKYLEGAEVIKSS